MITARKIYPKDNALFYIVEKLVCLNPKFNPVAKKITKKATRKFFVFDG
jgi:hypothetical protein